MSRVLAAGRCRLAVLLPLFLVIGVAGLPATHYLSADSVSTTRAAAETNVLGFLNSEVQQYATTLGPFQNGVWVSPDNTCWACNNGGPATAAATAYVLDGGTQAKLLDEAEQTINTAIATRQSADGSFSGPAGDTQSAGIATMFFGVEFGTTYHLLASDLDGATRARWQASLAAAANYLTDSGDTTWYANGNINLGYTEFLYLVWQATGNPAFEQAYNASWSFTLNPPQNRFPGSGLVITQQPTQTDGSDGKAYLTEAGAGGNGFDADYTLLQLDVACRLYLLSGDHRALWLANMLFNTLMPRVNTSTWMFDISSGTRHTQPDRQDGFMTAAFAVLGLSGGRSALIPYILPELKQTEAWYPQPGQADSAVFRRAIGNNLALVALAAASSASGQVTAPVVSTPTPTPTKGPAPAAVTRTTGAKSSSSHPRKQASRPKKHHQSRRYATARHRRHRPRPQRHARHQTRRRP